MLGVVVAQECVRISRRFVLAFAPLPLPQIDLQPSSCAKRPEASGPRSRDDGFARSCPMEDNNLLARREACGPKRALAERACKTASTNGRGKEARCTG